MAEETDLGLHADPGRAEECEASRGPLDDRVNLEGARPAARAGASDLVANVSPRALGRDRRRRFLHDRSVDVARPRDVLHRVCDRPGLPRVPIIGSTSHPDDLFMRQVGRTLTAADEGVMGGHRVLICDRDAKWSAPVRERLGEAGIRVVQTPFQAPNANAYAERCAPRRRREETVM